jgi:glycerol-3-phosphate acyltransferase PlsY
MYSEPTFYGLVGLAYLVGSIPFGLLFSKMRGVDLRRVGSGNIGATNVFRAVGKGWGLLTLLLDAMKGWGPAVLFPVLLSMEGATAENAGLAFGVAAIAGHTWPIYLRFRGGKGVATSAGVLLGLAPAAVGIGLLVFAGLLAVTRYVSLGSIGAAVAVALSGWLLYRSTGLTLPGVLTLLAALIVWRHRSNLRRLLAGTEQKLSFTSGERVTTLDGSDQEAS